MSDIAHSCQLLDNILSALNDADSLLEQIEKDEDTLFVFERNCLSDAKEHIEEVRNINGALRTELENLTA